MAGRLIRFPDAPPQSHGVPVDVALEEAWMEARAIAGEAERFAVAALLVARGIQAALAAGRTTLAATFADRLEREAARAAHRSRVARIAAAVVEERCPGDEDAGPLHGGRAA